MAGKNVVVINDLNFDTEVLKSDRPVLVDFTATWCGPCKQIAPMIDELATESDGKFKIAKLDIDEAPEHCCQARYPRRAHTSRVQGRQRDQPSRRRQHVEGQAEGPCSTAARTKSRTKQTIARGLAAHRGRPFSVLERRDPCARKLQRATLAASFVVTTTALAACGSAPTMTHNPPPTVMTNPPTPAEAIRRTTPRAAPRRRRRHPANRPKSCLLHPKASRFIEERTAFVTSAATTSVAATTRRRPAIQPPINVVKCPK